MINWLNQNSGASQVILAAVLIGVTIYYAIQARRTVKILEKQTEVGIKPVIAVDHFHVPSEPNYEDTYCVGANLINIGAGVAVDITVEFTDFNTDKFIGKTVDSIDFLKPSGEQSNKHIHIETEAFKNLKYSDGHYGLASEMNCRIAFSDIRGQNFKTQQKVFFIKEDRSIRTEPGTLRLL
jgi:hypothetical protein